jgi:hypothetical protein
MDGENTNAVPSIPQMFRQSEAELLGPAFRRESPNHHGNM